MFLLQPFSFFIFWKLYQSLSSCVHPNFLYDFFTKLSTVYLIAWLINFQEIKVYKMKFFCLKVFNLFDLRDVLIILMFFIFMFYFFCFFFLIFSFFIVLKFLNFMIKLRFQCFLVHFRFHFLIFRYYYLIFSKNFFFLQSHIRRNFLLKCPMLLIRYHC